MLRHVLFPVVMLAGALECGFLLLAETGWAGEPVTAEVIPAPPQLVSPNPVSSGPGMQTLPVQPRETYRYSSAAASRDAYLYAEPARRWAVDRQLGLLDSVRWYNTWARPEGPLLPDIYAYGSAAEARAAYCRGDAPVFEPWPRVPGDIYGYPYYPYVKQSTGYERIWTSHNGYVYRPIYDDTPAALPTEPYQQPNWDTRVPRVPEPLLEPAPADSLNEPQLERSQLEPPLPRYPSATPIGPREF